MKAYICLVCAAIAGLFVPSANAFCWVPQPQLVCAEYFASQLVVEATLTKISPIYDKRGDEAASSFIYTLRVNRALRGEYQGSLRVLELNDSGRATFDWTSHRDYLLFLNYSANDKAWSLDGCGNSGPMSKAKAALAAIDAIEAATGGGVIHGIVSGEAAQDPSQGIAGIHIKIHGVNGNYTAITNAKGAFNVKVPAGEYRVRVVDSTRTFKKYFISYEDPDKVRIEPGGCVQIQFAEVEHFP